MKKYKKNINLTPKYLQSAAYRYLERFATTEANLAFVLRRKVERILRAQPEAEICREDVENWIGEVVKTCVKNNLVDDRLYAQFKVENFLTSGNSFRVIEGKLRSKGVPADIIQDVLQQAKSDNPDLNFVSAIKYARKRRFGPFRLKERSPEIEKKEQASMARAGFSYDETRKIMDASREELEDKIF